MGVSIDKCFHCGGMWFDDQEFETLVGHEQTNIFSSIVNVFRAKKVTLSVSYTHLDVYKRQAVAYPQPLGIGGMNGLAQL